MTKVNQIASAKSEDCGINTYTTSLEESFDDIEATRTGIKSYSTDFLHYIRQTLRALRDDADIIHLQHEYGVFGPATVCSWPVLLLLLAGGLVTRKPIVVTMHSIWTTETADPPLRSLKTLYVHANNMLIFLVADHIVFLSEHTKDEADAEYQLPSHSVMPHGVQVEGEDLKKDEARALLDWPEDADIVVEPGYLRPQKGYEHFIDAAADHPDKQFIVAGGVRNEEHREYYQTIRDEASGNVAFTGVLEEERFHATFAAADLCYLPYNIATQSGIVNWSAAYSLPVFGSTIPYFREMSEKTGGVATYTRDEAPEAIATYFEDRRQREQMRKSMYVFAQRNSMTEVAQNHEQIYSSLI